MERDMEGCFGKLVIAKIVQGMIYLYDGELCWVERNQNYVDRTLKEYLYVGDTGRTCEFYAHL